jgi:hypothetical protein
MEDITMPATVHISEAYKYTYSGLIRTAVQKTKSILEPFVDKGKFEGERMFQDTLTDVDEPTEITGQRFSKVNFEDTAWARRSSAPRFWYKAKKIDPKDLVFLMTNPTSKLVENTKNGMRRKKDQVIYEAFDQDTVKGKNFDTIVPYDEAYTLPAVGGFTKAFGLSLIESFADRNLEEEEVYVLISPAVRTQVLSVPEFINNDYRNNNAMETGVIGKILNMNFIVYNGVHKDGNIHKCFAFTKQGIQFAVSDDITVRQGEIMEEHFAPYVYTSLGCAALRVDEPYVSKLLITVA